MLSCVLCGSPYQETDIHCPGGQCGADFNGLRSGNPVYAVQAWCEPREVTAEPGETVMVKLILRNAGSALDRYEPHLEPDADPRTAIDRSGPPDVFPGEQRTWHIVLTVPQDNRGTDAGPARVGGTEVPGFDGTENGEGGAFENPTEPAPTGLDVPIRVISTSASGVAAGALFSIRRAPADGMDGLAAAQRLERSHDSSHDDRSGGGHRRLHMAGAAGAAGAIAVVLVLAVVAVLAATELDDAKGPVPLHMARPSALAAPTAAITTPTSGASTASTVTVPDVVGKTQAQGFAILRQKGFRPTAVGTGDTITSTDPAPGEKVDRAKTAITVVLSASTSAPPTSKSATPSVATVRVPAVANFAYARAETQLVALGLTVARVDEASASAPGTVLRTSPAEGAMTPSGSTVTVTVAKPDGAMTVVPDLYNRYMPDAFAMASAAGLTFDLPYGNHLRMCRLRNFSPGVGAPIRKGGTIKVLQMVGCD
ncbi:PASTA domain-containing protein [Embleya sp. NPDC127516]|uniref:PASTA domain-containing protein n=1 Tax=Embleya sp. NPDC127516 TaxID=3363990 RepID=UPI00381D6A72